MSKHKACQAHDPKENAHEQKDHKENHKARTQAHIPFVKVQIMDMTAILKGIIPLCP